MSAQVAFRALAFAQSLGVNTHMSWRNAGSGYISPSLVEESIAYLGVTHVRDAVPIAGWTLPEYVAIAATGITFDLLVSGPTINIASDLEQIDQLALAVPGSIASVEGPNEFNTSQYTYNGLRSLNDPAWLMVFGPALYAAVNADPDLQGVAVIAAAMANAGAAQVAQEGKVEAYTDSTNWHVYYGNGSQPAKNMAYGVSMAGKSGPGEPVTITETGYYTAVNAMQWGGGGVTPAVQAILTVNALFDAFQDGVQTTYMYELMDNIANPSSTDLEDSFGLFLANGTPKPAAVAVHDLTSILADSGATAAIFTTGTLGETITGLPSTGNSMLFEKSDGTFELIIWNEAQVWNETTKSQVTPVPVQVTIDLPATYALVNIYDPLVGTAPVQTLTNATTIQLMLGSDPYIIEFPPLPASQTYLPGAAGGTIDSIGSDTVLVSTGAATVDASGPTINIVGSSGRLTYSGTAVATITGGSGAVNLTLSGSGSTITGGSGAMTVVDLVGGNTIDGATLHNSNGMNIITTTGNDLINTGAWTTTNTITLGSGSDTVVANGISRVTGSTGNDAITVNGVWGTVVTGTGSSVVSLNTAGIVTTNGQDNVTTTAPATVIANGPQTTLTDGAGYVWFSGSGGATINSGTGGGYFNMTNLASGSITTASGAVDKIRLGAAGGTVTTYGNDSVQMGSGDATVSALGGTATVFGGSGQMTFVEGAANATVYAGKGAESFAVTLGDAGQTLTIQDFSPDLDTIQLNGYDPGLVTSLVGDSGTEIDLSDQTRIILPGLTDPTWHPNV